MDTLSALLTSEIGHFQNSGRFADTSPLSANETRCLVAAKRRGLRRVGHRQAGAGGGAAVLSRDAPGDVSVMFRASAYPQGGKQ
jgi:hypothetical protein